MCLAAIAAVGGAAMGVAQTVQQTKVAQRNFDAQAQAAAQNYALSLVGNQLENNQVIDRMKTEAITRQQEALRERGFIMAASGESGLSGGSNLRQLTGASANEEFDLDTIAANASNVITQNSVEDEAEHTTAKNAQKNRPKLGILQLGVSGASGGLTGYSAYKSLKG